MILRSLPHLKLSLRASLQALHVSTPCIHTRAGSSSDNITSADHHAVEAHASPTKKRKALLIGISYHGRGPKSKWLHKAWSDVELVQNLLTDLYGYDLNDIVVMTDAPQTPDDLQPTKDNLIRQMINLVIDPKEGDEFFIYYAGHAVQCDEKIPGQERDHKDEFILPLNAMDKEGEHLEEYTISDDKLREILVQPLIQADVKCQLIAVMDACTSGTLLDLEHDLCNKVIGPKSLFFRIVRSLLEIPPDAKSRYRRRIAEWLKDPRHDCNRFCNRKVDGAKANIICISACEDSQTLVEDVFGDTLAGILNKYLRNVNKRPSLKKLNRHLYREFKNRNRRLWMEYKFEKKEYKRGKRKERPAKPPKCCEKPQISSLRPLRMGTTLKM